LGAIRQWNAKVANRPDIGKGEVQTGKHCNLWDNELVGTDLDVLGDGNGLAFLEDAEAVGLFDRHVLDVVLAVFPALHMRLFSHDEGAQVAAVEHDHVGQTLLGTGRCV
jgi:hypothetical protein